MRQMASALVLALVLPIAARAFPGGQSSGGGKAPLKQERVSVNPGGSGLENPKIDMDAYLHVANQAALHRAKHRITEAQFLEMSQDPDTVILDARSRELYDLLHVRGAMNLSFPDISISTLAAYLPNKKARILIYCNNNFVNDEVAFPSKSANASLNLSTYIALYSYGYRNIYELGPLLDVKTTKIPLEPSR